VTQLAIIAGYLALLLGLGALASRMSRGTSRDYLLASHSIGPVLLLMSLFGTTMTAFALVGSTGKSYQLGIGVYGLMASSSGIVHSLCFFVIGVKLWKLGQKYGYTTQVEYFRDRLGSHAFGYLLFPVLVGLVIPYLLMGVLGAGAVINGVTRGAFPELFAADGHGVPPWLGSLVICLVVLGYVFTGGMRGTAWANAFQTTVFMVLGVVTFVVIAREIGGGESFLESLQGATGRVLESHPEKLVMKPHPLFFLSFLLIPLSAGMFPHLFQHWLTARSASAFKLPVIVHPFFILIVWVPCVMVGAWATSAVVDGQQVFATPPENVNTVLPIMVAKVAGPVLSGLLAAGILAAVMSSLDSQFLCLGTMFTNDIVLAGRKGNRPVDDTRVVQLARWFIVAIVAVTYLLSLGTPAAIFDLGLWCFAGFSGLVPLVVAALYWRRLTSCGAAASVVAMVGTWLALFFGDMGVYPPDPRYRFLEMLPVAAIVAVPALVLVVVSLLTRPPDESVLARFFPEKTQAPRSVR
jgi:SSS family solute:Na+ symporter